MTDVELKSCPFCGAPAEIIADTDDDGRFAAVACPRCGAGSRQHYFCGDDAREFAADAWNRRTPDPALIERVKVLEEALAGIADDFMTSEKHHPGYVLIPTTKFEQLREASALSNATGGGG